MWALPIPALLTKAGGLVMAGVYGIIRIATMAGIVNAMSEWIEKCFVTRASALFRGVVPSYLKALIASNVNCHWPGVFA